MSPIFKMILMTGTAWGAACTVVTAAEPPAPAPADTVGEVVVTARRTAENIQEAPVSVSDFTQRTLDQVGAKDVTDLQGAVPNLNLVHGRGAGDATNIYIRGVGQPDALQTFDPAVGVYIDDVYYSRIQGTMFNLLDLEDVEVLRGPQGTLYGKNTIGGALKLTTVKPSDDLRASADITAGDYQDLEAKVGISGPISPTVSAGISAMTASHAGYVSDPTTPSRTYNDEKTQAVRGQLAWKPSDSFKVNLAGDYTRENGHLTAGQATNTLTSAFGATLYAVSSPPPAWTYQASLSPTLPNRQPLMSEGVSATMTWNANPDWTIKSITAYRRLKIDLFEDIDATPLQLGDVQVAFDQHQTSQEFQFNYVHGPLTVVSGLYYLRETIPSHQDAYANAYLTPFTFLRTIDDDLKTTSEAAYVNASYQVTDKLHISGGLRYTDEEKAYTRSTSTFSSFAALNNVTFAPPFPTTTWTKVSPMASIDYQATPSAMLYARVAEGFQSGGFNGRANSANQNLPYAPENLISYEAGAKTEWFDKRLRLNGDVFYNDYTDFQASVGASELIAGIPTPILTVLNAGKLKITGAELELTAVPVKGLRIESEIGLLDAKYDSFNDTSFPGGTRAWETPAFSPHMTARIGAAYEWPLANGSLTLGGQGRYRSEMALGIDNADPATRAHYAGLWQDAYWVADAQLVWERADRRYSVGIYGKNIGGTIYKTDAQNFLSVGHIITAYYGDPTTWDVALRYRY
jgi:iron complex outermembrane receptor protein